MSTIQRKDNSFIQVLERGRGRVEIIMSNASVPGYVGGNPLTPYFCVGQQNVRAGR